MVVNITIPGEPKPKGRGRAVRIGKGVRVVTPAATRSYEATVAQAAALARVGQAWPIGGPLGVEIVAVHRRPGCLFRRKDPEGRVPRPRKPDIDNVVKAVLDGLGQSGIWQDDNQIVRLSITQYDGAIVNRKAKTSEPPHVHVVVCRWVQHD